MRLSAPLQRTTVCRWSSSWLSVHLSLRLSICFLHLVSPSTLVSSLASVAGLTTAFAMAPILFDKSIVMSLTFSRFSSGNCLNTVITLDGFVSFTMVIIVCFFHAYPCCGVSCIPHGRKTSRLCPNALPCSRAIKLVWRSTHAAPMNWSRWSPPCNFWQTCHHLSCMYAIVTSLSLLHCPSAALKKRKLFRVLRLPEGYASQRYDVVMVIFR